MRKLLLTAIGLTAAVAGHASITIATFADPTQTGDSFLFTWDMANSTLSGSWTASGLLMQTPGFNPPGSVPDTHFLMKNVTLTVVIPNVLYTMGAGEINYYTNNINNPYFTIDFNGGTFLNPFNAG